MIDAVECSNTLKSWPRELLSSAPYSASSPSEADVTQGAAPRPYTVAVNRVPVALETTNLVWVANLVGGGAIVAGRGAAQEPEGE